jgi:hypothetical protein
MTTLLVFGSRPAWSRESDEYRRYRDLVYSELGNFTSIVCVAGLITGLAAGPDRWAKNYFTEFYKSTQIHEFPADWDKFGRAAGVIRNEHMADFLSKQENPLYLGFWDGNSSGTKHMFNVLRSTQIPGQMVMLSGLYGWNTPTT